MCAHAQAMAGELYSAEVYSELCRVLRPGGKLYHYIGDPDSKASGRLFKGVIERLRAAGFTQAGTVSEAYGVVARAATTREESEREVAAAFEREMLLDEAEFGPSL